MQAISVVGSRASGFATAKSDIDLFIYVDDTAPQHVLALRADVADDLADPAVRRVISTLAPPNTELWMMRGTDVWLDLMYWSRSWAEEELDWRLIKQSPQAGFSTAHWRSIRDGLPLFERDDWHRQLQNRARSRFPDALRDRIIALNRELLDPHNPFSFLSQAENAIDRDDRVAVHHQVARWLASYFDTVFAWNRVLHPGEKRLPAFAVRECEHLPADFPADVERLMQLSCVPGLLLIRQLQLMFSRLDAVVGYTLYP